MAPAFDSIDVTLSAILSRVEKSEKDLNETHGRLRENANRIDQLALHSEDCRGRIINIEEVTRVNLDRHYEVSQKVELLESKLDDMRSNLTKVVEGQIDILNSNANTREQFASVLTTQGAQHAKRMKHMRTVIWVGGGFLLLASQVYAKYVGNDTLLDMLTNLLMGRSG
jgi:chromosome segregation ATPase